MASRRNYESPEFDPEFADTTRLLIETRSAFSRVKRKETWEYQLLVVNPMPIPLAMVAYCLLVGVALGGRPNVAVPVLVLGLMAVVAANPFLFRYHCLDCGRNRPLINWKQHCCPPVRGRAVADLKRPFPLPSASLQASFWGWLIFPAVFFIAYLAALNLGLNLSNRP